MITFYAATVAFVYQILSGNSYQACFQKVGGPAPSCVTLTASGQPIVVDDGAEYDFWAKVNGEDGEKVRHVIPKKKIVQPTLIVQP